mgnify:CR=1 FL=1
MNEVYRYLKKLTIWTMAGLILFATLVALMGTAKAGEMEDVMLSIEKDMDICIESKDPVVCQNSTFADDYMIKFMGNPKFMQKLATCTIGMECYSNMIRLVTKMSQATNILMGHEVLK